MEFLYVVAFSTGLILLARSLRPAMALKKLPMQAWCDYKIKAYAAWQASTQAPSQPARSTSERLRMPRFSKSRPTELEAVAELIWFAELKYDRGEFIWFDDLPTIRNSQGAECVVLVRTQHFLALLGEREELRRRNAIVLNVPQANA